MGSGGGKGGKHQEDEAMAPRERAAQRGKKTQQYK